MYADVNHFRFIMRNLLSNAIIFSRSGGTIEIEVMDFYQPGFFVISVKDRTAEIHTERSVGGGI